MICINSDNINITVGFRINIISLICNYIFEQRFREEVTLYTISQFEHYIEFVKVRSVLTVYNNKLTS